MEIFTQNKNPKAASYWVTLSSGKITASGAPSKKRLSQWSNCGVTDIVTLQRSDEMPSFLPHCCTNLNINWHHFPLSGRHLQEQQDMLTLARIPEILTLLQNETHQKYIVVHCAAGMHRTGVFLYILMRYLGISPDTIKELIGNIREITHDELHKDTPKGKLVEKAEALYNKIFF